MTGKAPAARFENERTCSDLQALKSSPRPGVQSLTEGFPSGGLKEPMMANPTLPA